MVIPAYFKLVHATSIFKSNKQVEKPSYSTTNNMAGRQSATERALECLADMVKNQYETQQQQIHQIEQHLKALGTKFDEVQRIVTLQQTVTPQQPTLDLVLIDSMHISGDWTTNLKLANSLLGWETEDKRHTFAQTLKEDGGDEKMLIWILGLFSGKAQVDAYDDYMSTPIITVIKSTSEFYFLWKDFAEQAKSSPVARKKITDRMLQYAKQAYHRQGAKLLGDSTGKDKHGTIPSFMKKYESVFLEWTAQLVRLETDREDYVKSLTRKYLISNNLTTLAANNGQ